MYDLWWCLYMCVHSMCFLSLSWSDGRWARAEILGQMFQDCKWGFMLSIHFLFFHHLAVGCSLQRFAEPLFLLLPFMKTEKKIIWRESVRGFVCVTASRCLHSSEVYFSPAPRGYTVALKLQDHGQRLSQTHLKMTFLESYVEIYTNLWDPQDKQKKLSNICSSFHE